MINDEFLNLLRCPDSRLPLRRGDQDLVRRLNAAIAAGQLRNRAGNLLDRPVDGLLVREDGRLAYPIMDDIPIPLIDEALELVDSAAPTAGPTTSHASNGL